MVEDTKGVIRSRKSKDRRYNNQRFADIKAVIRIPKFKDRQYNDQKPKIYDFDYPFVIFKPLVIVSSVLRFTASDYPFGIFKL
jgi:hypothetical protein